LSLRANAIINGEISTSKLQIEEGASFSGNCSMNNRKPVIDPIKEESSEDNMVY
jgi:cytoskeletal protein CcmA (bactofilin family)